MNSWLFVASEKREYDADMHNTPILITGCQRSGTTLLSLVLNSHPQVHSIDEVDFDNTRATEYFTSPEYHSHVAFKLPSYAHLVESFANQADARIIWCIRDPRAVITSMMTLNLEAGGRVMAWARHPIGAQREIDNGLLVLHRHGRVLPETLLQEYVQAREMPADLRDWEVGVLLAALCWRVKQELLAVYQTRSLPLHVLYYEKLVAEKEGELRSILDFLGLPWHDDVLQHHRLHEGTSTGLTENTRAIDEQSVEKWKKQLTAKELERIMAICGDLANQHGYRESA